MSKTKVRLCAVCHQTTTHRIEEGKEYVTEICEGCGTGTNIKQLTWKVDDMLNPKTWTTWEDIKNEH